MWLSTLHFLWSFFFYFVLSVVVVTLIGAWKKLSQEKDKAAQSFTTHLSSTPPLPLPWPSRAPSTASTDSFHDTDDDDDPPHPPPRPSRLTPPSHHLPPPSRAGDRDRRRSGGGGLEEEGEEGVGQRRRRRGGVEEEVGEEEDEGERDGRDGQRGAGGEEEAEGEGDEEREEEADPALPTFSLPLHHRRRSSPSPPISPSSSPHPHPHPPLTPLHLPSPSIIVYLEFARLIRALWLRGELRLQGGTTVERLMEKERERGRLPGVAVDVLRELMRFYGRRKRPEGGGEGAGGAGGGEKEGGGVGGEGEGMGVEEKEEDVYALMGSAEGGGDDDEGEDAARVRAINAAVSIIAVIGQEERLEGRGPHSERERGEVEGEDEEKDAPSLTGELNLRLQRLLALPLPGLSPLSPAHGHTKISITSPTHAEKPVAGPPTPLLPLPPTPVFDPFTRTTAYLSDSHSVRCAIAQLLCTDRPNAVDSAGRTSAASSTSPGGVAASATGPSPFPALRPVYATPALQTRYLNVELMGEMELVLFRLQKRLEHAALDNLNAFVTAPPKPSPPQPPPPPQLVPFPAPLTHPFATPPAASTAAMGSSPASTRSSASSISPGAPVPALPPPVLVPPRSSSSENTRPASASATPHAHVVTRMRAASTTTPNGLPHLPSEPKRVVHHHTPHSHSISAAYSPAPLPIAYASSAPKHFKPSPSSYRAASPASHVAHVPHHAPTAARAYTAAVPYHTVGGSVYHASAPSLPPRPPSSGESSPVRVLAHVREMTGDAPASVKREVKVVRHAVNGENGMGGEEEDSARPRLRGHHRSKSLIGTTRFSM